MIKYINNKYVILTIEALSTILIAILYSLNNIHLFIGNFFLVLLTFFIQIISIGFFLYVLDSIIIPKKNFKIRFLQTIKTILVAQMVMFPISFILLLIYPFYNISSECLTKIIVSSTNYMVLVFLFLAYPLVTKADKYTSIKVASSTIIIVMALRYITNFLI